MSTLTTQETGGVTADGVVKWFDADKGYGFLTTADYRDIFVHASQLVDPDWVPDKTDRVTFIEDRGRDGRPYARRVVQVAAG